MEEDKFYQGSGAKFTVWAKVRCGLNRGDEGLAKLENFPIFIGSLNKLVMDDEYLHALGIGYCLSIGNNILEFQAAVTAGEKRKIERAVLRIKDDGSEGILNSTAVEDALAFMDQAMQASRSILVHCEKGISRSATMICAYLITRHQLKCDDALTLLRQTRPQACPNIRFSFELRKLEAQLEDKEGFT
jgi:Dual specificity phosphatase, catalytic domain